MTEVIFTRGGLAESAHTVSWCATAPDGEVSGASADDAAGLSVFPRSAVKPLQALPAARAGLLAAFGLDDRHLALACASHGGTAEHLAVVHEVLAACGASEADLACGPLEARDAAVAAEMRDRHEAPTAIVHNCSGKHALGIALCAHESWERDGYWVGEHPLQRAMHDAVAEAVGEPDGLDHGADGCGMRAFQVPLGGLARAFGRLASGGLGEAGDQVARAMRAHPHLVAFRGALDTELMAAEPGLVAKIGAEGVLAVGLPDGRGLALKVLDGAMRALDPAGVAVVREALGLTAGGPALDVLARPGIHNSRGERVGEGTARLQGVPSS